MQPDFPHDYDPGIAGGMPPGFSPTDFVAGSWFLDALEGSPNSVGHIVPAGYEACVHLPHPYWAEVSPGTSVGHQVFVVPRRRTLLLPV